MWPFTRRSYDALEDQESKPLQQEDGTTDSPSISPPPRYRFGDDRLPRRYWQYMIWMAIFNFFGLAVSTTLFLYWFTHRVSGMNALLKATSHFSPVLEGVELKTSVKMMNATFFPGQNPGFARQFPNPEADAIWEKFELLRTIPITKEDVIGLGKDPEKVAKFDNEYWGLGDNAYMAQVDVFHQLHCLNQIRKIIYPNYYGFKPANLHHPDLWYTHLNHCVDILAQNLMCTANTDMYTLQWMETQGYPFPDFNINHQCRDFDALLDWSIKSSVDLDMWVEQKRPKGVKNVPADQELLDWIESEHHRKNMTGKEDGGFDVLDHEHGHGHE